MAYIDLRDIIDNKKAEPDEYKMWRKSIKEQSGGYSIEEFAKNCRVLIPEYEMEAYARDYAEDVGLIQRDMSWPCNHIDWEAATREFKQDYSAIEVDGTTYYYRS
jgi:antirestriction protein